MRPERGATLRPRRGATLPAVLGVALAAAGCRGPLPAHRWRGADDAVATLAARGAGVNGVAARGTLTLRAPDGRSVRLETALSARIPGALRLRGWKLQQAVLDVLVRPEGTWSWFDERVPEAHGRAGEWAPALLELWSHVAGAGFAGETVDVDDDGGATFLVRTVRAGGGRCAWRADRRTLTLRECRLFDASGAASGLIRLERYEMIDGVPWPTRLVGTAGTAGTGRARVELDLVEIELNPELPEGVWRPSPRATRAKGPAP